MPKKTPKKTNGKHETNGHAKGPKRSDNGVERARYQKLVPVKLELSVVAEKADEMAAAYREREACLEERRTAMAGFKDTLVEIDERMAALAESVEKHTEMRSVECIEYLNVETNQIDVVRTDTGEVLESRTAEAEDRQEALFGAGDDETRDDGDPDVDDADVHAGGAP